MQTQLPQGLIAMLSSPQLQQMLQIEKPQTQQGQKASMPGISAPQLNMQPPQAQNLQEVKGYGGGGTGGGMGGGKGGKGGGLGTGSSGQNGNFASLAKMIG